MEEESILFFKIIIINKNNFLTYDIKGFMVCRGKKEIPVKLLVWMVSKHNLKHRSK